MKSDDFNNGRSYSNSTKSYLYIIVLLIIGIIVCFVFNTTVEPEPEKTKPESVTYLDSSIYNSIADKNLDESIDYLKAKGAAAKRIIPSFPEFPNLWLIPPTDKGSFDSLGERYCVDFLDLLFPGHYFKKIRPKWLRNDRHKTNRSLELDGYCEELMMAVEYNGIQHYEWPNWTGCTYNEYLRQRERDEYKAEICIQRHICLIRIPYTVPMGRIPLAIYAKLLDAVPELSIIS